MTNCDKCGGEMPEWDDTPHTEAHCTCAPFCSICRKWCAGKPGAWSCACDDPPEDVRGNDEAIAGLLDGWQSRRMEA